MIVTQYPHTYSEQILREYHYIFIRDLFESGIISYEKTFWEYKKGNKQYINECIKELRTQPQSNIGICMESFIQCYLAVDSNANYEMLKKCYHSKVKQEYCQQCFALGLGLESTNKLRKQSFDSRSPHHDIIFIKKNKNQGRILTNNKSYMDNVGFQVKSITTNIIDSIVVPIHKKKYAQVLTLLEIEDGYGNVIHTKDKCILHINSSKSIYNKFERKRLSELIISPNDIGIPQENINNYYNYMIEAFNNEFDFSEYIYYGLRAYYQWLEYVAECMNKQRQLNSIPSIIDENYESEEESSIIEILL